MAKITFIEFHGAQHVVEVPDGTTVMRGAVDNAVPGIDGDCGGQCACATCHVFVDAEWLAKLGPPTEMETEMLSFAATTQANSRLGCQIEVTADLDGLIVRMPEGQH